MATQQVSRKNSIVELFTDTLITLCDDYLTTSQHRPDDMNMKENPEQVHILYLAEKEDSKITDCKNDDGNTAEISEQQVKNSSYENDAWGLFKNRENFVEMHCG